MPIDIVDQAAIADRLDVTLDTVYKWRHRGVLPSDEFGLAVGPLWTWSTIREWALETGRLPSRWPRTDSRG